MRTLPRLVAIGSALTLGLTAAAASTTGALAAAATDTTTTTTAPSAVYVPPPLTWGPCASRTLQFYKGECAMLTVPLDYANPQGTKIKLAISRIAHTSSAAKYQGVMLTNPGGPGGSGLTLSVLGQYVPKGAGSSYDWIGFDPRGVGSSEPSPTCNGDYFGFDRPDYIPSNPTVQRQWFTKTNTYARDCAAAAGLLLDHVKTTDTVADMESMRIALGQQKINFYGFSYGTYLAQVYATLHPQQVRRFVIDGTVDPRGVWYQGNLDQDIAFDEVMPAFWAWIAENDSVYHLGTDPVAIQKTYYKILGQLRQTSVPVAGIGTIGPDEWTDAFLGAGYYVYGWADTASAFSAWVNDKNYTPVAEAYIGANGPTGPGADNGYLMYLATQCTDAKWPSRWTKWATDNWTIYGTHPFETWANAWFNAPCRTWAAQPGTPVKVKDNGAPGMLMIGETRDAATPFEGSLYVRSIFPKNVLIEGVGGTTHAGSLSGIRCTDNTIADYLATGALPARVAGNVSDRQCKPVPPPAATLTTAAAKAAAPAATDLQALRRSLLPTVR
ncbi:alpha/beta fold hydrolase [Dermatophilaceae bacterium Soc4.6]